MPLLVSIAIHAVVIALLASITFRYELVDVLGIPRERKAPPERIQYLVMPPPGGGGAVGNGSNASEVPRQGAPAPLRAPTRVPTDLPEPSPSAPSQGAISGKEGGAGGSRAGIATGVEPASPDPRIPLAPGRIVVAPRTMAERVDSTMREYFRAYNDSLATVAENAPRDPRDWTVERDGKKWGIDPKYIHLGRWKLPSAVLALLPLQPGGVDGNRVTERRNADWIRRDVLENAQRSLNEDEFKAAIKRIRARKERERKEKESEKNDRPIIAAGEKAGASPGKAGVGSKPR